MARRLPAAAVALMLLVSLAACSKDKPSGLPTLTPGGDSSETPTATSSTPTGGATTDPSPSRLPDTIAVHQRKIVTRTPVEKAVADAFVQYITVRLTAYNKVQVDLSALARTATGKALNDVRSDVSGLKNRKQHTVGEVWIDIAPVVVTGQTAKVTSCMDNTTVDVDAKGKPTDVPKPFYNITSTLQLAGGKTWVVSAITFAGQKPCK
jgi:hypothetical protein